MQSFTKAELRMEVEQLRKRINELETQARETDRILHENTLRQEKKWSQKIIDNAPNIILGLQENSKIVVFNRFAERRNGYRQMNDCA
jgi:PAS domain-containing protein